MWVVSPSDSAFLWKQPVAGIVRATGQWAVMAGAQMLRVNRRVRAEGSLLTAVVVAT